jgi:hypothetical protein
MSTHELRKVWKFGYPMSGEYSPYTCSPMIEKTTVNRSVRTLMDTKELMLLKRVSPSFLKESRYLNILRSLRTRKDLRTRRVLRDRRAVSLLA